MYTVVSFLGQLSTFSFFNQSLLAMTSKSSLALLARNLFPYLVKSLQVYLLLKKVARLSHAECGCEGTFLLIFCLSRKFRCSALTLKKVENPQTESFLVTERYCMPCRRFEKTNWANSLYYGSNKGSLDL